MEISGNSRTDEWKVLESEYIIQRPWLTAKREKLELPDGRIVPEYYVLEYPDWVNVIAVTEDGRMVMERQYRHAAGRTNYEIPCGVMEANETPLAAAKRELEEETGYGGGEWMELMQLYANPSSMNNVTHCFLAKGVKKVTSAHLDATEELSVHIFSQEEVQEMVLSGQIIQSLMAAPLLKYFYEAKRP